MSPCLENGILSKVEVVLPKNVIETCYMLPLGVGAEFLTTNVVKATSTRIHVFKENDESVKLCITVSAVSVISGIQPEHVLIQNVKKTPVVDAADNLSTSDFIMTVDSNLNDGSRKPVTFLPHSPAPQSMVSYDTGLLNYPSPLPETSVTPLHSHNGDDSAEIFCDEVSAKDPLESALASALLGVNSEPTGVDFDPLPVPPSVMTLEDEMPLQDSCQEDLSPCSAVTEGNMNMTSEPNLVLKLKSTRKQQLPARFRDDIDNTAQNIVPREIFKEREDANQKACQGSENITEKESCNTNKDSSSQTNVKQCENTTKAKPPSTRVNFEKCTICQLEVKNLEALCDHLKQEHGDIEEAQQHIKKISNRLKATCQVCREDFSSLRMLDIHMMKVHANDEEMKCDKCGMLVGSALKLEKHFKRFHKNKERFLCHLCPSSFKMNSYLNNHLKHVHTSNKEAFTCDQCGKKYATEKYLYNHQRRVHGHKNYACRYCFKTFTNSTNAERHVLLMHERNKIKGHTCPFCDRFFTLKFNMKDHIKTVHRQEFSHKCDLCGAGFRRASEVQIHLKSIHGDSKVKFSSPVKRKPGRPRRSLSQELGMQLSSAAEGSKGTSDGTQEESTHDIIESTDSESGEIQYILATPEMLQVLGFQPGSTVTVQSESSLET